MLNNQTCPLCRTEVEYKADYDSFEYCLDNLMLTNYVVNEFIITDDSLISHIKLIIHEDGHYYDLENWQILLKHNFDPKIHITTNNQVIIIPTQLCPQEMLDEIMEYFKERNEDEWYIAI